MKRNYSKQRMKLLTNQDVSTESFYEYNVYLHCDTPNTISDNPKRCMPVLFQSETLLSWNQRLCINIYMDKYFTYSHLCCYGN